MRTRFRMSRWVWGLVLALLVLPLAGASAQGSPQLSVVAEFSLGDNCPITGVLNSEGTAVWTLMENCVSGADTLSLQAFSFADGGLVGQTTEPLPTDISPYDVLGFDRPLSRSADGAINVDLVDTYTTMSSDSFTLNQETGAVTPVIGSPRILTADQIMNAIPDFTGYTDYLTYSDDRALALTQDDTSLYVFDVASAQLIMQLAPPGGVEYAGTWISADNQHLYVSQMVDPGNYDNPAQTFYIFDIPSGELVSATAVPHRIYSVSPDERFLLVSTPIMGGDNESLALFEPATGAISETLPTRSTSVTLNICKNNGRTTDYGWTSDDPTLIEILWLPDSSGFVTLSSEEFSSGPNPCFTNDSRMRVYAVTG
ncbi:MAG: hypothetical protein U0452_07290 [Anaerolineae bacterium]